MKVFRLVSLCFIFVSLVSCAGRVNGTISIDGSAAMSVSMSLEPRMTNLIRSLSTAAGQTDGPVLNAQGMAQAMSLAPGIASVLLRNTTPSAIEGTVQISEISDFLSVGQNAESGFIIFKQGRCEININRNNGPVIVELLSSEIEDFLNALMAPIATGEILDKSEYLDVVASFYSKAVSDEIAASRIRASIEFPGSITSVRGGTFSGRRADFDISLLDLLVLESPINIEVRWR